MCLLFFYTDPGSGLMLLQVLLATIAGAAIYFRSFIYRLFGGENIASSEVVEEDDETTTK